MGTPQRKTREPCAEGRREGSRALQRAVGARGLPGAARLCSLTWVVGVWMGAKLCSGSFLRVILPPGNTGQCLGRWVVVAPEAALACSGCGQGCCLIPHSARDGPTANGPAQCQQCRGQIPIYKPQFIIISFNCTYMLCFFSFSYYLKERERRVEVKYQVPGQE